VNELFPRNYSSFGKDTRKRSDESCTNFPPFIISLYVQLSNSLILYATIPRYSLSAKLLTWRSEALGRKSIKDNGATSVIFPTG